MPVLVLVLVFCLLAGCQPPPEPPLIPPHPEDLSTWTVPELVQLPPRPVSVKLGKGPVGPAEKVADYAAGVAVEVPVALGQPLDIILEAGEQIREIVAGDRTPVDQGQAPRWEVKEGGEGSGPATRPHIFITVTEAGLTNGLTITTTKRSYYVTCKSVAKSPIRVLRWHYGPEMQERPPAPHPPGLLPDPDQPTRYHVGYALASSRNPPPSWIPRHVVDDGKKTYLVYPEVTLFESVPLLRLVGPTGPQLVNARQYLNVVIVDQLLPQAELRVGTGEQAEVVTLTRGALRTITCPGDALCPVWPAAATLLTRSAP